MDWHRPKSAPAENIRPRTPVSSQFRGSARPKNEKHSLEGRLKTFHTTERMASRMRERRRTEVDIFVNETPAGLLAMEHPTKKISQIEVENLVARVCRPTASYSARVSSNRRRNAKDIYVPPKVVRVEYFNIEHDRFKGNRLLNRKELENLVTRLSSYDAKRRPPESRDSHNSEYRQRLGSIASYRWQGIKNC